MIDLTDYLMDVLAGAKVGKGDEINADCPFCGKAGHLYANPRSHKWVCFKCDAKGKTLTGLVAEVEGLTWQQAQAALFRRMVTFKRRTTETPVDMLQRVRTLRGVEVASVDMPRVEVPPPAEMIPIYDPSRLKTWRTPMYLRTRGITREAARFFAMGYCERGYFHGRLILPFDCPNGCSFVARDMTGKQDPKYLFPKGVDQGLLVYGWETCREGASIVLVEGQLDAVRMWQHGYAVLGLGGKVLHDAQLALLRSLKPASVVVMLDADGPGQTAVPAMATKLAGAMPRTPVHVATLPEGVDPGASTWSQAMGALRAAVRWTGSREVRASGLGARLRGMMA